MKIRSFFIFLFFLLIMRSSPIKAEIIDSCIAVVNEDVITLSDVNEAGKPIFQQIIENAPPEQRDAAIKQARENIVKKLIEKKLLIQQAALMNISVTDAEIEHAQEQVLRRNSIGIEEFKAELEKIGSNQSQYRATLREQILSSKLINYEVRSKVVVPEERIREYYDNQYIENVSEGNYYVLQIGFLLADEMKNADPDAVKKAVRKEAEAVRKLAAAEGQDFKKLARQYSDLPSATDGGDIGTFQRDEMAAYMRDAVIALQPGEISPVVESPDGYMIFKLLSSRKEGEGTTKVPYEEVKQEIRNTLYKEEIEQRYKTWIEKIRSEAYVKIL
ncbi:MAG: hypothetical protein D3924_06860 [Candidatus Electrothrix sp. AR4]|nr:hypothetical protein [Candidatus Electrothrix sp. AR4]